jgi:hypothetical protein
MGIPRWLLTYVAIVASAALVVASASYFNAWPKALSPIEGSIPFATATAIPEGAILEGARAVEPEENTIPQVASGSTRIIDDGNLQILVTFESIDFTSDSIDLETTFTITNPGNRRIDFTFVHLFVTEDARQWFSGDYVAPTVDIEPFRLDAGTSASHPFSATAISVDRELIFQIRYELYDEETRTFRQLDIYDGVILAGG